MIVDMIGHECLMIVIGGVKIGEVDRVRGRGTARGVTNEGEFMCQWICTVYEYLGEKAIM